jgi:formylglycine-generating enzyme
MNKFPPLRCIAVVYAVLAFAAVAARADVFNMGGARNADGTWNGLASLEFVTVGDPGNAADTTGYGAVPYVYQMGKYDVTLGQYCQFLNAVATISDPYGLYNSDMINGWGWFKCGITQSGITGSYTYAVTGTASGGYNINNMPVTMVSWGDAARFCNWLQNGQPSGTGTVEGTGTTETGAYTLNGTTSYTGLMLITRNTAVAAYLIPTENEWYKATYYRGGGTAAGYWMYPTRSNTAPSNVLSGTGTNDANCINTGYTDPTNYLTTVGAFAGSPGPYGTYDQGGDVWQWNEGAHGPSSRDLRGGAFDVASSNMVASVRIGYHPTIEYNDIGFRVASVPEPASIALLFAGGVSVLAYAWRRRRAAE